MKKQQKGKGGKGKGGKETSPLGGGGVEKKRKTLASLKWVAEGGKKR